MQVDKPKYRFCWACSAKLWGNHHTKMFIDGHERILHKRCANAIAEGQEVVDLVALEKGK